MSEKKEKKKHLLNLRTYFTQFKLNHNQQTNVNELKDEMTFNTNNSRFWVFSEKITAKYGRKHTF